MRVVLSAGLFSFRQKKIADIIDGADLRGVFLVFAPKK